MIEFQANEWTGCILQGNAVHATPVARSAPEAVGCVVMQLRELVGDKLKIDIRSNDDNKIVILASTTASGYPAPEDVEAFVLPTTRMGG